MNSDSLIIVYQSTSIWSTLLATFFGALAAFIFSLLLFFFRKSHETKKEKKALTKMVKKELELNINYLKKLVELCDRYWEITYLNDLHDKLLEGEKLVEPIYQSYKSYFTNQYLTKGHFYDLLSNDEIETLEEILYVMESDQQKALHAGLCTKSDRRLGIPDWSDYRKFVMDMKGLYTKYSENLQKISNQI